MKTLFIAFATITCVHHGNAQTVQDGLKQLENENFSEALATFNRLKEQEPQNADITYYIGEVHYALEEYTEAEAAYKQGLKINLNNTLSNIGMGKLQLDKAFVAEAERYFNAALRNAGKDKANVNGLIGDAYLYNQRPNSVKAIEYLTIARDLDPKVARFWSHLGDAYKLNGEMGKAMSSYEVAVEKDMKNVKAYRSMASIWTGSKREDLAITNLEQAISLDPEFAPAYKDLYELYIRTKQFDKVVPILEKYVTLTGDDVESKVRLVKFLCFQARDYAKAIEEGEKLLQSSPEQYTLHRWLAWSYAETGKPEEAFHHSKKLFEALAEDANRKVFPSDYEYWAKSAFDLKLIDDAAHIYRKYLDIDSSRAQEIYGKLAKAYFDAKNFPQAIVYYTRKNAEQPLNSTDQYYLGLSHYYTNAYTPADSIFTAILAKTPDYAQGWMMRARIANQLDPERKQFLTKPYYEKYVEYAVVDKEKNKKNLIEACNYLGYYFVQQDDIPSAIRYYEMSIEMDPANEEATQALSVLKGKN